MELLLFVLLLFGSPTLSEVPTSSLPSSLECLACESIVEAFGHFYAKNATKELLLSLALFVCEHLVNAGSAVCQGIAHQYREELIYVVGELVYNPPAFCGMFIEECGDGTQSEDWNVTLSKIPPNQTYPSYPVKRPNMRVLQITDIHIDSDYVVGSVANCKSFICCHSNSLSLNGTKQVPAGYWGSQNACDIPMRTVENAMQHINRTEKLDYILVSGDYVAHTDWEYTKEHHLQLLKNLSDLLEHYFPMVPKYYALGNHDSVPINSFAPHYVPKKYQPKWVYKQLWEMQRRWVGVDQVDSVKYRGSYSKKIMEGLRLISLNTGYCLTTNLWIYLNQTDPDGTFTWLVNQLTAAESEGEYVHIMSHVPPGNSECLESWSRNYYKVINRFSKTIKAQFFGHIHTDSFTIFYKDMNNDQSEPTNFLFSSPSLTTYAGMNPAYRIYEITPGDQFEVFDYSTYFMNLSRADGEREIPWELLYSAKTEYGLDKISAKSMNTLIDRIIIDDELQKRNTVRRNDYKCDYGCIHNAICTLKQAHHNDDLCSHVPGHALFGKGSNLATRINELAYQIINRYSNLRVP